jgi:hypothetical protein
LGIAELEIPVIWFRSGVAKRGSKQEVMGGQESSGR